MKHPTPSHLEYLGQGLWAAAMNRWLTGAAPEAKPSQQRNDQEMENRP